MLEDFPIGVGVHQGLALSPLLFKVVMEEATKMCRRGDQRELLYANDLAFTADSKEEVIEMFHRWRNALERCGMKINVPNTKLSISGKEPSNTSRTRCNPCAHMQLVVPQEMHCP